MTDNHPAEAQEGEDPNSPPTSSTALRDSNGWDGKLRVGKRAEVVNAEILSDPEHSDEDAPPVEQIAADDGRFAHASFLSMLTGTYPRSPG